MTTYQPTTGTSRVIDDLQSTIDNLKNELNETKATLSETRQKYSILVKRNETMVEQLSNAKHQAEVAESLLKRKERRVLDLETQLTEISSNSDSYRFECENLKLKLKNFESDKFRILSENERLSKSHEILQSSFNDYKLTINYSIDNLKTKIPEFINSTKDTLNENLNNLKLNQPEINSSYNLVIKNSKRLEELYNQKFEKVNNYLLLLANSTKEHGQSTSIVMEECEEILKKLNRNEDVLLRIKNETNGNLNDLDKMKEFNKIRDLSILNDSSNIHNSDSLHSSPIEKRKVSPGILDSRFNIDNNNNNNIRSVSPENDLPNSNNNNNNNNRHKKRNSINITKKDRRKRNSYRQSMNQEDFANLNVQSNTNINDSSNFIDFRKRVISTSSSSPSPPPPPSSSSSSSSPSNSTNNNNNNTLNRSNSTRKNNRNSRNFSSNNRRWSMQPNHLKDNE